MKRLPNALSLLRLLLAPALLFLPAEGLNFWGIYLFCGLSDVLDGFLARRFHWESPLGARLDSLADLLFFLIALYRLWPLLHPGGIGLCLLFLCAAMRLSAALIARIRFGRFGFLHTRLNKLSGLLLFLYAPLGALFSGRAFSLLCGLCCISALEELCIQLRAKAYDPDSRGLF